MEISGRHPRIAAFLLACLVLLGGVGLGWLLGLGLNEVHSTGNRSLEVLGVAAVFEAVGVLVLVIQLRQRGWLALFGCYIGGETVLLLHIAGVLHRPWWNGLLMAVLTAAAGLLVGACTRRWRTEVMFFLPWFFIPMGCGGLGWLLGWGVAGLNSAKSLLVQLLGVLVAALTVSLLVPLIRWFGPSQSLLVPLIRWFGPSHLVGRMALYGYLCAQGGALMHLDKIYHWSWWMYILVASIGNSIIFRGLASRGPTGETGFLDP